jgi:hypothetical protein
LLAGGPPLVDISQINAPRDAQRTCVSHKYVNSLEFAYFVTQLAAARRDRRAQWNFTIVCRPRRSDLMRDKSPHKVLVPRPGKIRSDGRGRSVWVDPVESAELELVSTQMLKQILTSRDASERNAIEKVADTAIDGVLARDTGNGQFEIIDDDDLRAILDANKELPKLDRPADVTLRPLRDYVDDERLSLVSTQALRKVLRRDDGDKHEPTISESEAGGFNPYDRN